ncbi:MAG TPA: helix-hairpin-helix domain-containing protein [Rugosibacter sp.]
MNKLAMLLVGLVMVTFNVFAAVNVNTATQEQLESLNGIGPAKAKAIIDYRQKNGAFKTLEDIDKVPGVGAGIMGKIKNDVTLTGATTVKAEPSAKKAAPATPATKAVPAKAATPATPAAKAESPADAKADKKAAAKAEKEAKKAKQEAEKAAKKAEKDAKKSENTATKK